MRRQQTHRGERRTIPNGVALNLLASALTILTAIALLGAATVLGDTSAPVVVSERHERVIHEFYGAVNEAVRSGDATALDRLLAPDLVFHPPSAQIAPNRAGLERYLTSIHDTDPAFQLQVEAIVSDGDRAVAHVVGDSEQPGGYLGLTFAAPAPWGQFDCFRIAGRQIVELRSGAPAPVLFEPATESRLALATTPQAVSFERLSASREEHRAWGPLLGPRVLYVDTGTITVEVSPTESPQMPAVKRSRQEQPTPVAPGRRLVVTAGEMIAFPSGFEYRFRHDATDSGVAAFTVALPRFRYTGPYQPHEPTAPDDAIEEPADWGDVQTALDGDQGLGPLTGVTVALGRALLPPGASLAFDEADGYLFAVVETGTLVLVHEHQMLALDRLDRDGLGLVKPGEPFALHNLGEDATSVLMVTVLPRTTLATPAS